jgi:hypothetical protein
MDGLSYLELEVVTFSSYTEAFIVERRILKINLVKAVNLNEYKNQNELFLCRLLVPWSYGNDRADPKRSRSGLLERYI